MALSWKLVIDAKDAPALAGFWAAALGYEVEDPDAFIGPDELVAQLESLGATRVREVNKGLEGHWWIMQDPEGNEFCAS